MPQEKKPKKHVRFNETLTTLSKKFGVVSRKSSKAKDKTIEDLEAQLAQKETANEQRERERERERERQHQTISPPKQYPFYHSPSQWKITNRI